ncbi:MAG TPA: NAD(P)-dependent oxidoreductase [Terriglobia bacterium]|nr:NAD(P)-dependent oxidoreductase [Terriglobia bacterium]
MILLLESLHPEAEALLERCEPLLRAADPDEPQKPSDTIRAILTRGRGRITDVMMGGFPALRAIARAGAGLDNLDTAAAARRNIPVIFAPSMNGRTVAEHTLALMLDLVRRITPWANSTAQGRWEDRRNYRGGELAGLTLGIFGYGNIGTRVARLASAFEMRVVVSERPGKSIECEYPMLPFEELLSVADVITLHLPLTKETMGILGVEQIARMKPTACVVNTARGALIDQGALRTALLADRLGGFAGDVLEIEPPDAEDPLLRSPRVLLTPHVASLTSTTYRQMCIFTAENVVAVLEGRQPAEGSVLRNTC